jgi:hypothetical protein
MVAAGLRCREKEEAAGTKVTKHYATTKTMRQVKTISDWGLTRTQKEFPSEGLTHALWETADGSFALYFYKIVEYGMARTCSKLQILKDKSHPRVVYDSHDVIFDCNIYDWNFLLNNWTDKGYLILGQLKFNPFRVSLILIKLETLQFVSWDKFHVEYLLTDNTVTLVETFVNKEDNTQSTVTDYYKLDEIAWRPLNQLTR